MRKCLVLAALVAAPALAVVACQSNHHDMRQKTTGEVVEKKYKPPVTKNKEELRNREPYTLDDKKNEVEHEVITVTETPLTTVRPECYQLTIRTDGNKVIDVCDKAAYKALDVGDPYDSLHDYRKDNR